MPEASRTPPSLERLIQVLGSDLDLDELASCIATLDVEAQVSSLESDRHLSGVLAELLRPALTGASDEVAILDAILGCLRQCFHGETQADPTVAASALLEDLLHIEGAQTKSSVQTETECGSPHFQGLAVLPPEADPEILPEALEEFLEHLEQAESSLLELESDPTEPELLATIFRSFHTVKGSSGFLGLDRVGRLAHLAENILAKARQGDIQITGMYADLVLESCDLLRTMVKDMVGLEVGDALSIPSGLDAMLDRLIEADEQVQTAPEKATPSAECTPTPVATASETQSPVAAEFEAQSPREEDQPKGVPEPAAEQAPAPAVKARKKQQQVEASIRVNTGRLDSLINMVGELVTSHAMITQAADLPEQTSKKQQEQNIAQLGKITRELQDVSMALRMVPLKGCMDKVRRLVRELARKSTKNVQFVSEGAETEIDRTMVEAINDPLVHMIRNSLDHGIESAQERLAAGKPEQGTITLRAYHSAGDVVIEIKDDGKGLDKERILKKAIDRGMIESSRGMSDREIYSLIFRAGLSTAEKVTDISGRGVGMDVVKRSIEGLRGRIDIDSALGVGTTISLRFPLTMAITDAMVVGVGEETYLLPTSVIQQSFHTNPDTITDVVQSGEMVMFRGSLIPIVRLHRLLDIRGARSELAGGLLIAIEVHGQRCALLADELLGQQQVVIKSLGAYLGTIAGLAGGAILGNGRVALILDAKGVMDIARSAAKACPEEATQEAVLSQAE